MKKRYIAPATLLLGSMFNSASIAEELPPPLCQTIVQRDCLPPEYVLGATGLQYIVIDQKTGNVLVEENANAMRQPASTVKLMTLYLAYQTMVSTAGTEQPLTVSTNVYVPPVVNDLRSDTWSLNKTGTGFQPVSVNNSGEATRGVYTFGDLLKATAAYSDGRAATAIAVSTYRHQLSQLVNAYSPQGMETYDTSRDESLLTSFVSQMNYTAYDLGMNNTVFGNPSGMPTEVNLSTPHDIAKLVRAMSTTFPQAYEAFSGQAQYYAPSLNRRFNHTSQLVRNDDDHHAGKTGTTRDCGKCYAGTYTASKDETLVVVVFGASTNQERDNTITTIIRQGLKVLREQNHDAAVTASVNNPQPK